MSCSVKQFMFSLKSLFHYVPKKYPFCLWMSPILSSKFYYLCIKIWSIASTIPTVSKLVLQAWSGCSSTSLPARRVRHLENTLLMDIQIRIIRKISRLEDTFSLTGIKMSPRNNWSYSYTSDSKDHQLTLNEFNALTIL